MSRIRTSPSKDFGTRDTWLVLKDPIPNGFSVPNTLSVPLQYLRS